MDTGNPTSMRKKDHMDLAIGDDAVGAMDAGWSDVHLVPVALPRTRLVEIDLRTEFLGHVFAAPLFIAGMTGGHPESRTVNARLAAAAEACGVGIGVGSQRAALEDPALEDTYSVVREHAPSAFVCANLGIGQLVAAMSGGSLPDQVRRAVGMVNADALAVHVNLLQELIQPEGESDFGGCHDALAATVDASPVPVIVKETGCGIDRDTARLAATAGVAALDLGGAGGTSFVAIETARAQRHGDRRGVRVGQTFADWGLATTLSILESRNGGIPIIASGGIRNGLDAAKAVALGANVVGVGRKLLAAALAGPDAATRELAMIVEELRISLLLCDCKNLSAFSKRQPVLQGRVAAWQTQRERG